MHVDWICMQQFIVPFLPPLHKLLKLQHHEYGNDLTTKTAHTAVDYSLYYLLSNYYYTF